MHENALEYTKELTDFPGRGLGPTPFCQTSKWHYAYGCTPRQKSWLRRVSVDHFMWETLSRDVHLHFPL